MFGIKKKSCNEFPYIELGLVPLSAIIKKRQYRFYTNVIKEGDWPLLRHIVRQSRDMKTCFIKYYDKLLGNYNKDDIINEAKQKLKLTIIDKAAKEK